MDESDAVTEPLSQAQVKDIQRRKMGRRMMYGVIKNVREQREYWIETAGQAEADLGLILSSHDALVATIASLEAKLREAEAREAVMVGALTKISEAHVPDNPLTSLYDDRAWALRHVGYLRRIASDALTNDFAAASALVTRLADLEAEVVRLKANGAKS